MATNDPLTVVHNQLVDGIIASIVSPLIKAGGNWGDICLLTESVLIGILIMSPGHEEAILDQITSRVRSRLKEMKGKSYN